MLFYLLQAANVLALESALVVIQRVAREIETHGEEFLTQPLRRQPILNRAQAWFWQIFPGLTEERHLRGPFLLMDRSGIGGELVDTVEDAAAVAVQLIKGARTGQHLKRALANAFEIHPAREIKDRAERFVAATRRDEAHRLHAHVFQRTKRVVQRAVTHGKHRVRSIHARRHVRQAQLVFHLFEIDSKLVREVNIAVHHTGHEFHRVVRLEPRCLVADHGIGGGVGFVEAVIGELVEQVPHLDGFRLIHTVFFRSRDEFRLFGIHRGLDFLTHGAAKEVSTAERIPGHDLSDLHHLLLVDDDALRLIQQVVN